MAQCRNCGLDIEWCKVNGKNIPLDSTYINVTPDNRGLYRIVTDNNELVSGLQVNDSYEGEQGYKIGRIVHWNTCGK